MSENNHTPEPWETVKFYMSGRRVGVDSGTGEAICYFHNDGEKAKANARRIVACVNWCAGNSTEGMERAVEIGRPYSVERDKAIERELELTKQRDDLLAALERFVAWNRRYPSSRIYSATSIRQIAHELDQIAAQAEAAIAAAQSNGQPEKPAETEKPAIVFYPAGSLGEEVQS